MYVYEKLTVKKSDGKVMRVILRNPHWGEILVTGRQVDHTGCLLDRIHVIERALVTKRELMVQNITYAELEPARE